MRKGAITRIDKETFLRHSEISANASAVIEKDGKTSLSCNAWSSERVLMFEDDNFAICLSSLSISYRV